MEEEIIETEETPNYDKLRYILNDEGYLYNASFGAEISCSLGECTEYTGQIPEGYETIEEWFDSELDKINAWKIIDGNLVFDNAKYSELKTKWEKEEIDNSCVKHSDIYEIESDIENLKGINQNQYGTSNKTGRVITISKALQSNPYLKLTNIAPYKFNSIDIIINGKNILPNEANTQTISGITFTQNEDRSISINGKSEADIEYMIAGASSNTSPILVLKKDIGYYLTSNGLNIKMYNFDGTDRTLIYSGKDGIIKFTDEDKQVTQIVLSIANGKSLDLTLFPQLEVGSASTEYETYKGTTENIDFSSYIETPLYPSETLFPSEELTAKGTIIDYIIINENKIYISVNGVEEELKDTSIVLYANNNTIYTIQNTDIAIKYSTNDLNVDSLEFLQGKSTTNNKFRILEDGSIEAHDGYFSGNVHADNLYLSNGGKVIGGDGMLSTIYVPGTMMTSGGGIGSRPMGFYLGYVSDSSASYIKYRDYMFFEFTIPKGFVVKTAYVYVNHMPIIYKLYGKTQCTGYTRNMALYRATSLTSAKMTYDQGRGEYSNSGTFQLISNALGGFTGSTSGLTRKKSINLKNYIYTSSTSEKYNVIKLQSNATCPSPGSSGNRVSDEVPLRKYTGSVNAMLIITGYTKFN